MKGVVTNRSLVSKILVSRISVYRIDRGHVLCSMLTTRLDRFIALCSLHFQSSSDEESCTNALQFRVKVSCNCK